MKPASRPKATRAEVNEILIKHSGSILPEGQSTFLVAIRGYYKDTMGKVKENDRGIYDDAIFLISPDKFLSFNANTDPSKYTPNVAKLIPGIHYFRKGNHGISKPGGGYPAFRPATPDESLPVTREGRTGTFKGIAINIHKGGSTYTSSAGCQTIWPAQWNEFKSEVDAAMDRAKIKKIAFVLIEQ